MKKISEVSALLGVTKRTLQYYDELGLINVDRLNGKDRIYTEKSIEALVRILIYKSDGLKLQEIKDIIELSESEQKEYLRKHIQELLRQKERLSEAITFANYIVKEGIANVEGKIVLDSKSTAVQQIEQMKAGAYVKYKME